MYEAHHLARIITQLLDSDSHVADNGADFRIVVTDTAGNVAEISYTDTGSWTWDEGCDLAVLGSRLGVVPRVYYEKDGG